MLLFYNKLKGGTGVMDGLLPSTSMKELQRRIFQKENVSGDPSNGCIIFCFGRKALGYDDSTLADYGIVKDDSIQLTLPSCRGDHFTSTCPQCMR